MYVCLCKGISDQDIIDAVNEGSEDLQTIQTTLGAGTGCGTCQDFTQDLITKTLASKLAHAA